MALNFGAASNRRIGGGLRVDKSRVVRGASAAAELDAVTKSTPWMDPVPFWGKSHRDPQPPTSLFARHQVSSQRLVDRRLTSAEQRKLHNMNRVAAS
ncbi:Hypothetical predicted protein [Cloeon dipterum]|uniref:Uncharacterized protein n=1 Tax=Cloeon dipterum TaxID=197152 RepID=A0A8S1D9B8_9INSE|nr:Hypothetical predicted protein [Cloeon dipterum]